LPNTGGVVLGTARAGMTQQKIKEGSFLALGLCPKPRDLSLWGQNGWPYNESTGAEDRATQRCDPSADSSAGMAEAAAAASRNPNRQTITFFYLKFVLKFGFPF